MNSDVSFIVVATPSQSDGSFSNEQLEKALRDIAIALSEKNKYHLVVITSTVMPGTTIHVAKYILEKVSLKTCGRDFGLAYNPEFIALGSVIRDFLNPDFILIGEVNQKDGDILQAIYRKVCENNPRFARMLPINAEIAKIALNCYLTMKISFANSLASICEQVPGSDSDQITNAIGLDSRIGKKYLKGSLGFGGPCFPRDNVAFSAFAEKLGMKAKLSMIVDEINKDRLQRIIRIAKRLLDGGSKVSVLGLSYKPNTDLIEDSQAIDIVQILAKSGFHISVYDPMAQDLACSVLGDAVQYARSLEDCLKDSELCIIATAWNEFKTIDGTMLKRLMKKPKVLDCWRLIEKNDLKGVKYKVLGKGK